MGCVHCFPIASSCFMSRFVRSEAIFSISHFWGYHRYKRVVLPKHYGYRPVEGFALISTTRGSWHTTVIAFHPDHNAAAVTGIWARNFMLRSGTSLKHCNWWTFLPEPITMCDITRAWRYPQWWSIENTCLGLYVNCTSERPVVLWTRSRRGEWSVERVGSCARQFKRPLVSAGQSTFPQCSKAHILIHLW